MEGQQPRKTSFGFLRRQKSGDVRPAADRSTSSSSRLSRKQKALAQEELARQQREADAASKEPPRLPSHSPLPKIHTFGAADERPDSIAIISNQLRGYTPAGNYSRPSTDPKMSSSPPHGVPVPPIPGSSPSTRNGEYIDPYARTESMTHRGRYSYASSAVSAVNSPRRVRRRKDPTPFNILIVGAKNSGKTSFINFLQTSLKLPAKKRHNTPSPPRTALPPDSPFTCEYIESEIDGEGIGLTLWDSQGLEKNIVDLQLREMSTFLEAKFEETFTEEQKVIRAPGVRDTHIHCVFLILDPGRLTANIAAAQHTDTHASYKFNTHQRFVGVLDDDFDLQVLRTLQGKTTVIPVISKADTITTAHMTHLKKSVWNSLKEAKLDPLEALELGDSDSEEADRLDERDEDDYLHSSSDNDEKPKMPGKFSAPSSEDNHSDDSSTDLSSPPRDASPDPSGALSVNKVRPAAGHRRTASAMSARLASNEANGDDVRYLPFSILSPDTYEPGVIGRRFPWGFADPYNAEHCDFMRLKESVFGEWRAELREASRDRYYEGWRTSRLKRTPRKTTVAARDSNTNGVGKAITSSPYTADYQGSPEAPRQLYRGVNAYQ
ncbi:hypothetical protein H2201_006690 [Coniosporium apollinis]|uniref:Septin-type G domain-containing protein n=1 Tax=Coniosporium apollinis TaxID=61459 RepID=A0ABQ9NNI9_9PEZI|nr:hypothetical protein H2201_006690 [Coniosporium apollinis]